MDVSKDRLWAYWEGKHTNPDYEHKNLTPQLLEAIKAIGVGKDDVILDHGCGQGRLSLLLCSLSDHVHITDLSSIAIKKATEKIKEEYPRKIVHSFCGDVYNYEVAGPFDLIISHRVLHTMPMEERKKCLLYFNENIKSGCHVLISARSVFCREFSHSMAKKAYKNTDGSKFSFVRRKPFKFMHFFSENALKNEIKESGLRVISISTFEEETGNLARKDKAKINSYLFAVCRKP